MCRKILWYYILALTLLDISLKTKLTAQGKSNGATLHDSLIDGINFQEWGSDAGGGSLPSGLALEPATLNFGRSALAAPHVRSVTLANNGNATLHLASVAGTTPDFHASFFESKTLAPQSNTTFNVVYLGRREGPAAAHLYIHTSLGVYNYPVSAVGVASEYDVWPLVGVRVPANASVEPMLTLYNPTDTTIQVSEVYSSGAWLGLQLPSGEASGPRALWAVPPHASRDIVRLRVAPPASSAPSVHDAHEAHDAHDAHSEDGLAQGPLTAYVRLKANIPGGSLVVGVEAQAAPAGEHAQPLQLRLRTRAHRDPPLKVVVRAANSAQVPVTLAGGVATRCVRAPLAPPDPCAKPAHAHAHPHNGADTTTGAHLEVLLSQLEPLQNFTDVAQLTIDYAQLWAGGGGAGGGAGAGGELACAGCVRVGRALVPYSLRLVAGTLRLHPASLQFVMGEEGPEAEVLSLRATNECERAVHVLGLALSADGLAHFALEARTPLVLGAGQGGELARLRLLRGARAVPPVAASLALRTNLSDYRVPVQLYSGRFQLEWEWPWEASEGQVSLGALGTSATRRVSVRLRNAGPARLCVTALDAHLSQGSAQLALAACANAPPDHPCRCAEGGGWVQAWLVVVAPARAGLVEGRVGVRTRYGGSEAVLSLRALPGRLRALRVDLPPAAPYAWSSAELVVESTMALEMRVLNVSQPTPDPAVSYKAGAGVVRAGRLAVGRLLFAPEHLCQPHCYTGLDIASAEGLTWLVRSDASDEMESLREDAVMLQTRLERFKRQHQLQRNLSLHLHTTEVKQISVTGSVQLHWPRLRVGAVRPGEEAAGEGGAEGGVLAAVGATRTLRLVARNPSLSHALLLQPAIHEDLRLPEVAGGEGALRCENGSCVWAAQAFAVRGWRARRGLVREWGPAGDAHPVLVLAPAAELELTLSFTPPAPKRLAAYLYLRNNLTILEGVLLTGEGAYPSFELAGRKPGSASPIVFEVTECSAGAAGAAGGGGGGVRRTVLVRNTGRVRLRLRDWRLSGAACQGRGFLLEPCAPLSLAPNESRALHLTFAPDFTLARVSVRLQLRSDLGRAEFALRATVPARLLPRCAAHVPRPPWEPALRAAAALAALAALALVVAAAALDAERLLRKARVARAHAPPRAPLDLRAPAPAPSAPPPAQPSPLARAPAPRRRRAPRRPLPPLDPQAERRAFERWRAEVLRRADDDDSRSSEDADSASLDAESPPSPHNEDLVVPLLDDDTFESPGTPPDIDDSEPEREPDEDEERPSNSGEEDAISLGSDASTPTSERGDNGERSEPDESETTAEGDSPVEACEEKPPTPPAMMGGRGVAGGTPVRVARPRRESVEAGRRGERTRTSGSSETPPARARVVVAKQHSRKEKATKRRSERAVAPPSRASPAQPEAAEEPAEAEACSGAEAEARGAGGAGALRWGTSWSSVVAARGALAPIGSDVRRRSPGPRATAPPAASAAPAPPSPPDQSLFYFNSGAARGDLPWRAPQPPTLPFATVPHDFLDESSVVGGVGGVGGAGVVGSAFGGLGSAWDGAWAWGAAGAVRPPPGFGAPPRPPRAYDPFRSLASIWAPGAADWRLDAPSAPANPSPPEPDDER